MTPAERVQKLEALLARVQRNRTAEPAHAAAPITVSAAPVAISAPPAAILAPPAPAPEPPVVEAPPSAAATAWAPEPGSGMQPRPVTAPPSLPPEEVGDDDLLEVTTIPPAPAAASPEAEIEEPPPELEVAAAAEITLEPAILEPDAREVSEVTAVGDEQAPVSSSRFRVPATLDEAIASAAEAEPEAEREIPVKTPPPESGPQEALPAVGLEAPRTPDVEQLEADLDSPPSMGPTAEQLGETIELEEPRGPDLEIDVTVEGEAPAASVSVPEELEVALPRPSLQSGLYDVTAPPPAAYPEPVLAEEDPSLQAPAVHQTVPVEATSVAGPERTVRTALGATDVADVRLGAAASPKTFVELLDASLGA